MNFSQPNRSRQQLVAISLAYDNDQPIEFIETDEHNRLTGITLKTSMTISESVDRFLGEDASGVVVCFDVVYSSDKTNSEMDKIVVRRGHAKTEYGTLENIVV